MYCITYKGKPATQRRLYSLNEKQAPWHTDERELNCMIVARTISQTRAFYLYHFGFTWAERPEHVNIGKLEIAA